MKSNAFMIISRSVLLRMRNVSDKRFREYQDTHFMFSNFFFENRTVFEIREKIQYNRAGRRCQYNTANAHWMLDI